MLDFLDGQLAETACDHTLRLTERWAREHGHDVESVTAVVGEFGGYCDCELLANVTPDRSGWPD